MTRSVKPVRGQSLAGLFATDPFAAVVQVLREAPVPVAAGAIKRALTTAGVTPESLEPLWPRLQKKLKRHEQVSSDEGRYAWIPRLTQPSALDALERVAKGGIANARKDALVAIVRAALERAPDVSNDLEDKARDRQAGIDAIRTLAELAIEVEELSANKAEPEVLVERVRIRVGRSGLQPIERAGQPTRFDRKRHKPIGGSIQEGAQVFVVRPGYVWKAPTEEILISKPVVEE